MTIASDMKDLADSYVVRMNEEADKTIDTFYPDLLVAIKKLAVAGRYVINLKDFSYYIKHTKNLSDQLRQDVFLNGRLTVRLTTDGFTLDTQEADFSPVTHYIITWN